MAEKKVTNNSARKWRRLVQVFFFMFVALIAALNGLKESGIDVPYGGEASLHAVCPFGGVVSFWNLVTLGTLVKKVHESSVVLAVIGILLALLFGPVLCGWVCPFGSFQEWIGKIGRKVSGKRYNTIVPAKLDRTLRYFRYVVLVWVSYMTVMTGKLAFQEVDPYYALFNFWRSEVSVAGFASLAVVIVLSLFVERPFCKYACPYGAFQGLFNLVRVFAIRRNSTTCINCKACSRACPMNIQVDSAGTVRNHQCISCMECTDELSCPVADTVTLSSPGNRLRIRSLILGSVTVIILFGGISISAILGKWNVSSSKQPTTIRTGEFAGMPSPSDIRGSYTWLDVSAAFGIPPDLLVTAFESSSPEAKVNTLEVVWEGKLPEGTEIGTDSVRLFVSLYTAIPHEIEAGTVLPTTAVSVLLKAGKLVPDRIQETAVKLPEADNVPEKATVQEDTAASDSTLPSTPVSTTLTITGKTTFRELERAGVDMKKVETLTGPIPNYDETVKALCEREGIEFSVVKTAVTEF